jgi:hypothetical protein
VLLALAVMTGTVSAGSGFAKDNFLDLIFLYLQHSLPARIV